MPTSKLLSPLKKPTKFGYAEKTTSMLFRIVQRITGPMLQPLDAKCIDDVIEICLRSREQLLVESSLLDLDPPIFIFGDIHGQLTDLLRMLQMIGCPPKNKFLFLGDYVDRGPHSVETITLLLCWKLLYPRKLYLLRGNHETRVVNRQYGFYDECGRKFGTRGVQVWAQFQHVFNCLPLAAKVAKRMFCAHGGISEELFTFKQFSRIVRPTDVCDVGMLCDLIWADPSPSATKYAPSPRGISQVFGKQAVTEFCTNFGIDVVCRAHQCVMDGYELFAETRCVTIFSAPAYCGEVDNAAGVLHMNKRMECRLLTYKVPKVVSTRTAVNGPVMK